MKTQNIIWGLVLVFVGTIILLDNFDVIEFYWRSVWRLWPLILVLTGANIIFSSSASKISSIVSVVVAITALIFIGVYGSTNRGLEKWGNKHIKADDETDKKVSWETKSSFSEPFVIATRRAQLHISGGATVYNLQDTTSNLFEADVQQNYGRYSLNKRTEDSVEILNFRMSNKGKSWDFDSDEGGNEVNMKLNAKPLWDISLETGAGKTEFDLTRFKVSSLRFKGGAASFEVKLGEPETTTTVVAETGVAEINIGVPSSVGCRIEIQSGLSSKNFDGFIQQSDGTYVTSNYKTAPKKININLKGGLSEFEVDRY